MLGIRNKTGKGSQNRLKKMPKMRPAPLPHTIPAQKDLYSSCLLSCFEQHVKLSSNGLGLAHSAHFFRTGFEEWLLYYL